MSLRDKALVDDAGKRAALSLSGISRSRTGRTFLSHAEAYLAMLQGKGSGSGWDLAGEVRAAMDSVAEVQAPILIDAGANIGEWSRMMYDATKGRCTIYQFEPARECYDVINTNSRPGMVPIRAAVGAESGAQRLFSPGSKSSVASLYTRHERWSRSQEYQDEVVDVVTLDEFLQQKGIDTVDFMKLDVEGAELDALRGAARSLSDGTIKSLSFEFGSGNINSRTYFVDFWEMLTPLGFEFRRILPGGATIRIFEYYEELEHFRGVSNYICVKT